jgi:hypothetical protein
MFWNKKNNMKNVKTVKVIFIKTYIGDLGVFYKNNVYDLTAEQFKIFKDDCKEIK